MGNEILNTVNAKYLDIKAYAGNILGTDGFQITLTDNATPPNPVNPSGPVRMEVRLNSQSPAVLVFAVNDGLTLAGNVITLFKQVDIPGGTYQYDISNVNADGSLETYLYGKFIVIQNITNPRG